MALNETLLLRHLQRRLGSSLFNCLDINYFLDILKEETLRTYSSFYPKLVKGIKITQDCAIPTFDPQTNTTEFHRYKIPKLNAEDYYLDIESYTFMGQGWEQANCSFNPPLADAAFQKVRSLQPIPSVRWSVTFEAPDFACVYPYRRNHLDFVLTMQCLAPLNTIPAGLEDHFKKLFVLDVKSAIYNEFPQARESGVINGVEINTNINEFSSAESDRDNIIEAFNNDWYMNPQRFETLNLYSGTGAP